MAGGRLARSIRKLVAGRQFEFAVERATFLTVLHRLFVSGSDRAAGMWRADYRIEGTVGLRLKHLYRTMAWLGEPLADQTGASELAPPCRKDLVEEELFARRRDLFAELSIVFMDTTSLSFEGQGGEELGRRGHSKDHRPDLHQMIVGLVMDQDGRPLCSELWPGNTADVATLLPVVDRLCARFGVGRICVVADRGMISAATIAALEERKLEYVLGVGERSRGSVIVGANQAWDETTALRCLPILAELGVRLVEQPLPAWNLAGMARLRARSTVPLMADECVFSAHDMLDVARAGAADVVSLKLSSTAGCSPPARSRGWPRRPGSVSTAAAWWRVRSAPRRICRSSPGCASSDGDASISARRSSWTIWSRSRCGSRTSGSTCPPGPASASRSTGTSCATTREAKIKTTFYSDQMDVWYRTNST